MTAGLLLLHGVLTLAAAGLFVGASTAVLNRDPTSLSQQRKWTIAMWLCVAGYFLVSGMTSLIAVWPGWDLPGYLVAQQVGTTLLALAFGYLTALLLFIYTGRERIWMPVAAFYAWLWLILLYGTFAADPQALLETNTLPEVQYASDGGLASAIAVAIAVILLLVPPVFALLLYASLWFKSPDNTTRYRVGMGSSAMTTAFLALVASGVFPDEVRSAGGAVHIQGLGLLLETLLSVLAGYLAYRTYIPGSWGARFLDEEP